jgi:hypothetical protein
MTRTGSGFGGIGDVADLIAEPFAPGGRAVGLGDDDHVVATAL